MAWLADGRLVPGYVTFSIPKDLSVPAEHDGQNLSPLQPHLLIAGTQLRFWFGSVPPRPGEIAAFYTVLNSSADRVFPIRMEASLPFDGEAVRRTVRVNGFQFRAGGAIIEAR